MLKIKENEIKLFEELKKNYMDYQLLGACYANAFLNEFKIFNDDEMGIEKFIKLLKNDYEIDKIEYDKNTLPLKSKFKIGETEYLLKKFDDHCVVMWSNGESNDCSLYYTEDVIQYVNQGHWKLI